MAGLGASLGSGLDHSPLGLPPESTGCSFGKACISQLEAHVLGTILDIGDMVP